MMTARQDSMPSTALLCWHDSPGLETSAMREGSSTCGKALAGGWRLSQTCGGESEGAMSPLSDREVTGS
jgi:hypothetical protein